MTPWDEEADRALEYVVNISVGLPTSGGLLFDTSAVTAASSNGITTFTYTNPITIGSGANRALLVAVFFTGASAATSSSPTATWAGANIGAGGAPLAGPYSNGTNIGDMYFFGMAAPASGANNLVLNWVGANQVVAALISFTGANQTGGATTFYGATGQTANFGNTATATIIGPSSSASDISVAGYLCDAGFSGGQGNIDIGFNSGVIDWGVAANYAIGATPTMTYSRAVAQNWAAGAIAVKHF